MLKKILKNQDVGKGVKADIEIYSRCGSRSPSLDIFIVNGKRLVPYQWKKLGYGITFQIALLEYLDLELLKQELLRSDRFFSKIAKDDNWAGQPILIPFDPLPTK